MGRYVGKYWCCQHRTIQTKHFPCMFTGAADANGAAHVSFPTGLARERRLLRHHFDGLQHPVGPTGVDAIDLAPLDQRPQRVGHAPRLAQASIFSCHADRQDARRPRGAQPFKAVDVQEIGLRPCADNHRHLCAQGKLLPRQPEQRCHAIAAANQCQPPLFGGHIEALTERPAQPELIANLQFMHQPGKGPTAVTISVTGSVSTREKGFSSNRGSHAITN